MKCEWMELLAILPARLRQEVDQKGKEKMMELRLRIKSPPEMVLREGSIWLDTIAERDDLNYIVNMASSYSPWNASTAAQGYLTASGGHRIGICGHVIWRNGRAEGIRDLTSLCIRVARDFSGIAKDVHPKSESILILGAPGWGKTTLLRDLIRCISEAASVCVIDERGELFPSGFAKGLRTDVMTGCTKTAGMDMALRTMSPQWIATDEITAHEDTAALIQAAHCGVKLLATAHAKERDDLFRRGVYRPLLENHVFQQLLILHKDKSWHMEGVE